jgi:hypothetical protein
MTAAVNSVNIPPARRSVLLDIQDPLKIVFGLHKHFSGLTSIEWANDSRGFKFIHQAGRPRISHFQPALEQRH